MLAIEKKRQAPIFLLSPVMIDTAWPLRLWLALPGTGALSRAGLRRQNRP
jgi:hypothetical protein